MAASAGRVLLMPKGTYNAATTYNMLDVVYYDGATYVCKQTSLGNLPTDTDYWQLMASSPGTAAQVSFDPTGTGLVATNVQDAVVEVKSNVDDIYGEIGTKNLNSYPYYETSKNTNGITFTVNSDGSIDVSGTASADALFYLHHTSYTTNNLPLNAGTYIVNGCPSGGGENSYFINVWADSVTDPVGKDAYDYGSGAQFTLSANNSLLYVAIRVKSGTAITGTITFYPMIRSASISDSTWQPYGRSKFAFRTDITSIIATGSTNTTGAQIPNGAYFYLNGVLCRATANIATSATFTKNTNYVETSVGSDLTITPITLTFNTTNVTDNGSTAYRIGNLVIVNLALTLKFTGDDKQICPANTLPLPASSINVTAPWMNWTGSGSTVYVPNNTGAIVGNNPNGANAYCNANFTYICK